MNKLKIPNSAKTKLPNHTFCGHKKVNNYQRLVFDIKRSGDFSDYDIDDGISMMLRTFVYDNSKVGTVYASSFGISGRNNQFISCEFVKIGENEFNYIGNYKFERPRRY